MVAEDAVSRIEFSFLESPNILWVLGGGGSMVMSSSLLPILASGTDRMAGSSTFEKTQSKLVQVSSHTKFLYVGKPDMP